MEKIFGALDVYGITRLIVSIINGIFIIFVLFFERKNSTSRFAWLMFMLFFPGIGIFFYILFSGNFFTASRRMREVNKYAQNLSKDIRQSQKEYIDRNRSTFPNHSIKDNLPLIDMNLEFGDSILTTSSSVDICTRGKDFFEKLCATLENAKESIYMEYFIFHQDKIGNRVMEILTRKAQEGVDVKLIYDDLGSIFTRTKFFKRLNKAGGEARPFFLLRIGLPLTLNYRNHRKLTVIDNEIAFIGGINIGDEYANNSKKRKLNWRDTVAEIHGTSVILFKINFLIDWFSLDVGRHHLKKLEEVSEYFPEEMVNLVSEALNTNNHERLFTSFFESTLIPTQIVNAGPTETTRNKIEDAFITMINGAKKYICIQTPYFTPTEQFFNALKIAAHRGVHVDIMIPSQWDKIYMKGASYQYAREMIDEGVNFYLYNGFIHAKMITVDGSMCSLGTTNIDNRSFSLHYEQNVFFYDKEITSKCETIFLEDSVMSKKVDASFFDRKNIVIRALWSLCKLFSPFM